MCPDLTISINETLSLNTWARAAVHKKLNPKAVSKIKKFLERGQ